MSQPWPQGLLNLLHASQHIREDTHETMSPRSPMHIVSNPEHLTNLRAPKPTSGNSGHGSTLERLCLVLFQQSGAKRITWMCYCSRDTDIWLHAELIQAWNNSVHQLPPSFSAVYLDVTPAPEWMSSKPWDINNPFIYDKRAESTFLSAHIGDISYLIKAINRHYNGTVAVHRMGKLSTRNQFCSHRMTGNSAKAGIGIDFRG